MCAQLRASSHAFSYRPSLSPFRNCLVSVTQDGLHVNLTPWPQAAQTEVRAQYRFSLVHELTPESLRRASAGAARLWTTMKTTAWLWAGHSSGTALPRWRSLIWQTATCIHTPAGRLLRRRPPRHRPPLRLTPPRSSRLLRPPWPPHEEQHSRPCLQILFSTPRGLGGRASQASGRC